MDINTNSQALMDPQGIGYHPRFIVAVLILAVAIIMLFVYFVYHYSPTSRTTQEDELSHYDDQRPSRVLKALQQGRYLVEDKEVDSNKAVAMDIQYTPAESKGSLIAIQQISEASKNSLPLNEQAFTQAGQAEISVFKNTHHGLEHNIPMTDNNRYADSVWKNRPPQEFPATPYAAQNQQSEKEQFLLDQKSRSNIGYMPPTSPYLLKAGSFIQATLLTAINSDLPGTVIAKVNRGIYDTVTGNHLLIPQGTTLMGVYDSQVSYGQSRVLLAWTQLIFPDGASLNLEGMPGVDLLGTAGLSDKVNYHYRRIFGSALLFSTFSAAGQLSQPKNRRNKLTDQQVIYGAIGQQMTQTGGQLIEKNAQVQPTIQIRAGARINVLLTKDIDFLR